MTPYFGISSTRHYSQLLISSVRKKSGDRNRSRLRVGLEELLPELLQHRCIAKHLAVTINFASGKVYACTLHILNKAVLLANTEIGIATAHVDLTFGVIYAHFNVRCKDLGLVAVPQNDRLAG